MRGAAEACHDSGLAGGGLQENGREPGWIYTVTFHVNPRRRVHSFWFLDPETAGRFYESVKEHPNVTDCRMYRTPVSIAGAYTTGMEEGRILQVNDEEIAKGWI